MSVHLNVKISVPLEIVAAIKAGKNDHNLKLLNTAVEAIKVLPVGVSADSSVLELAPSSGPKSATIPILPPARPAHRGLKIESGFKSFSLRILVSQSSIKRVEVMNGDTSSTLASKVKASLKNANGFLVLTYKEACIFDERWEDEDTAAYRLDLHTLQIDESSIVHADIAMNFR